MMTNYPTPCIPIVMEDDCLHSDEHPMCDDPTCPCQASLTNASLVEEVGITIVQIASVSDDVIR